MLKIAGLGQGLPHNDDLTNAGLDILNILGRGHKCGGRHL